MVGEDPALSMSNDTRHGDAGADYVNIKDGLLMAPSAGPSTDTVILTIKCPSLSDDSSESTLLPVPARSSIGQVKKIIESSWAGKPKSQGMRMFKAGQLLSDNIIVGDLVPEHDRSEPAAIHLVIRPSAWTESRTDTSQQHADNKNSSPSQPPSPHPAWVNTTDANSNLSPLPLLPSGEAIPMHLPLPSIDQTQSCPRSEKTLANVIESMDPSNYTSFRSLLTWSYYKYVELYEKRWKEVYGETMKNRNLMDGSVNSIQNLAKAMSCSEEEVLSAVDLVEREALQWIPIEEELAALKQKEESKKIYKNVTLQGLPYLLQVDRDPQSGPLNVLLSRIKRLQDIVHRMDKLISYQALFEQASNTSLLQANLRSRQSAALAAAAAPGGVLNPNGNVAAANRHYNIRLVFNLTEFFNIALPAFFLSLKVTLLVYMFTRGATKTKTYLIAFAGILFVLFESWRSAQRHRQNRLRMAAQEAERQERINRVPGPNIRTDTPAQPSQINDSVEALRPRAPPRHRAMSPLALDYWIETLAYMGLAEEDQDMQWQVENATIRQEQSSLMKQVVNHLLLPMILMLITLVPEIEQKRRKAIDEREELIKSTAKKVEDCKAKLAEKREKDKAEADEGSLKVEEDIPTFLKHPYCQRIIQHRRSGRQIDIAQELEAAAAAGNGGQVADMGFI